MYWKNHKNKYKIIKCPPEFMEMANSKGMILEHRLIAAKKYGRILSPDEVVHHINGKKWDNNRNNLIILSKRGHWEVHGCMKIFIKPLTIKEFRQMQTCISIGIASLPMWMKERNRELAIENKEWLNSIGMSGNGKARRP